MANKKSPEGATGGSLVPEISRSPGLKRWAIFKDTRSSRLARKRHASLQKVNVIVWRPCTRPPHIMKLRRHHCWGGRERHSIFVKSYTINHHRVAFTDVVNPHWNADLDSGLNCVLVKGSATARHVGHSLTETISPRARCFLEHDSLAWGVGRNCPCPFGRRGRSRGGAGSLRERKRRRQRQCYC